MNVKPTSVTIPTAVPASYERPVRMPQQATPLTDPVSPDDVVDCVEIRNGEAPAAKSASLCYGTTEKPSMMKGTLIDIRI